MRSWVLALLLLPAPLLAARRAPPPPPPAPGLLLAETAPIETVLDDPDLMPADQLWVQMIDRSRSSVDLGEFYVTSQTGGRLEPVLAALERAGARGVTVRLLVDQKFGGKYPDDARKLDERPGIELRFVDYSPGVMHAKYFIIDGKEAWVGSQNFDWRSLEHITELGLRFDEPAAVQGLQAIFQMDWARAGGQSIAPVDLPDTPAPTTFAGQPVTLRLVGSPQSALPDPAMWDWPALQAMLRSAKSRIRLQVMSYELKLRDGGYWDELDRELRAAAARGVKVELILGQWGRKGHKLEAAQSLDIMENIDVRYVVIPDWSGGRIDFARVVHSKYLVVDGEHSWVGTSNASGDYFLQSRNVGLLIEGKAMGAALDDYFERHWNSPYASGAMEQQK